MGDKILVRKGNKNLLAIGEITGDYKFKKEWVHLDIAHIRDVRYTAIAKEINLFDIMVKHLKKNFQWGIQSIILVKSITKYGVTLKKKLETKSCQNKPNKNFKRNKTVGYVSL